MSKTKNSTTTATTVTDSEGIHIDINGGSIQLAPEQDLHLTFSESQLKRLDAAESAIRKAQRTAEGLAQTIAGQLYIINKFELHKARGYKGIGEYAGETFGISKATCSEAISVFERFGDKKTMHKIDKKYEMYSFSVLNKMKKLTDEEIERIGLTPEMIRSDVVAAIDEFNKNKRFISKAPEMKSKVQESLSVLGTYLPNDEIREIVNETAPNYFTGKAEYVELEKLNSVLKEKEDKLLTDKESKGATEETDDPTEKKITVEENVSRETSVDTLMVHIGLYDTKEDLMQYLSELIDKMATTDVPFDILVTQ